MPFNDEIEERLARADRKFFEARMRRQRREDRNIRCFLPSHVARWMQSTFSDIDVAKARLRGDPGTGAENP